VGKGYKDGQRGGGNSCLAVRRRRLHLELVVDGRADLDVAVNRLGRRASQEREEGARPEDDVGRHADDEREAVEHVGVDLGRRQGAIEAPVELNATENAAGGRGAGWGSALWARSAREGLGNGPDEEADAGKERAVEDDLPVVVSASVEKVGRPERDIAVAAVVRRRVRGSQPLGPDKEQDAEESKRADLDDEACERNVVCFEPGRRSEWDATDVTAGGGGRTTDLCNRLVDHLRARANGLHLR
jgi:hypothetical protein